MPKRHPATVPGLVFPLEEQMRRNRYIKRHIKRTLRRLMPAPTDALRESVRKLPEKATATRELEAAARGVLEAILKGDAEDLPVSLRKALQGWASKKKRSLASTERKTLIRKAVENAHIKEHCALTMPTPELMKNPEKNAFCVVARKYKLKPMTVHTYYYDVT